MSLQFSCVDIYQICMLCNEYERQFIYIYVYIYIKDLKLVYCKYMHLIFKSFWEYQWFRITTTSYDPHSVSNYQSIKCLFNNLYRKKHLRYVLLSLCEGIHRWPVDSPYKGTVTRKCFHLMTSYVCGDQTIPFNEISRELGAFGVLKLVSRNDNGRSLTIGLMIYN